MLRSYIKNVYRGNKLCQAHMIRTYSSKLDQAERHFKEIQSQWDELTQQEELRQLDRNGLMI